MAFALVSLNQILYDRPQVNITAWSEIQEDATWLQEFADEIRASANQDWDNVMVNDWSLENITVSFIVGSQITYSVVVAFTLGNLVGNMIGDGLPASTCLLVSTTHVGPRPNRGRVYFSGFPEAAQTNGKWESGYTNSMRALVSAWRDGFAIQSSNPRLQIARRPNVLFPLFEFNGVNVVSSTEGTRSQRRRNSGL